METVESKTTKVSETNLSSSSVRWVNHCTYTFTILGAEDAGMAVKITRDGAVIYAETIDYNKEVSVKVGPGNGPVDGSFFATRSSLTFNGNLEASNLVMTNMVINTI